MARFRRLFTTRMRVTSMAGKKRNSLQKNGERAGSPCRSSVRDGQGPVATAGLHAVRCRAIRVVLLFVEAGEGCAGAGADGGVGGTISALWLPADRDLSWPRRSCDELWTCAPSVAAGASSGATQAPKKAHRDRPPTPERADGRQPGVVVRLRVRLVRQRPAAQVPDRHRRMDKRGSCDRGGWPHPFRPRDRSVVAAGVRARRTTVFALGQWAGVCLPRLAEVNYRPRHRHRIDRSGQTLAEWRDGELNGKFRDECLSLEWFRSRTEAKVLIEAWRKHFNTVRPHSSLGYLTPAAFAAKLEQQGATDAQATGRIAAVYGASAPRPVAQPSRKGQTKEAIGVVVSS